MGARGPKPKPAGLKLLAGNPGKRPVGGAHRGRLRRGVPDRPRELTGEAAAEWDRIVPELDAAGVLAVVDRAGLTAYCMAWGRMLWAEGVMRDEGAIVREPVQTSKGEVRTDIVRLKPHPAVKIHAEAMGQVRGFLADFGMNPAARSRIEGEASAEAPAGNKVLQLRERIQQARSGG